MSDPIFSSFLISFSDSVSHWFMLSHLSRQESNLLYSLSISWASCSSLQKTTYRFFIHFSLLITIFICCSNLWLSDIILVKEFNILVFYQGDAVCDFPHQQSLLDHALASCGELRRWSILESHIDVAPSVCCSESSPTIYARPSMLFSNTIFQSLSTGSNLNMSAAYFQVSKMFVTCTKAQLLKHVRNYETCQKFR